MVRYSPLSLGFLVVSLALPSVSGAPAPFYPVVNVDGGSSAAETVPVTENDYFTITASTWREGAVYTSCNAFTETVEHTTTVTVDQQSTITRTIGITSVTTDYQTLTLTEYHTIRLPTESNASVTFGYQNAITDVHKTLTVTRYPTGSPSPTTTAYVTVTPSHTADDTTTVTITAAPITITETIGLTSLQFEQVTLTHTQYVTVNPEQTTVVATPTVSEEFTTVYVTHYSYLSPATVTIVRTVKPTEVSSTAIVTESSAPSSSFVLSAPLPSEPLSGQKVSPSSSLADAAAAAWDVLSETSGVSTSNSVTVIPSSSMSSSAESVTVTVTERVPFLSSPEPVTVTVTESVSSPSGVAIAAKQSSTPVTAVTISSEVDSTITVTQPGETYTLIIDRTAIVTDGYTTYVTEYHALSPSVSTTSSSSIIEATSGPSSRSSSSGDGTSSTILGSLNVPTLTPLWTNTTITTTTIAAISTYYPSTDTIPQSKPAHNGTFI
ncbi:hypothetical protein V1520DRAFT_139507 [Lipomyces starkeyi]|uniref:Agglutinin-like protein N-terminal domain-containing protein n=1 Tax=Lipomyces starkeyi NRRL Y-11557 TaxID=675824 RepID=A0A1E3QGG0_LIPST|nr:hypothetical protein LIPSTDRAFT_60665 [Lipomyces starkeyi NRRL Y-11557]